jgi:hypothetical protein
MSLPSSYFDNYADPGVKDRSYAANWKRYGFQLFDRYMSEIEEKGIALPKTALDIGAANGAAIEEMGRLGIKARGIEASRYIYDTAKPETKKLIAFGDATELIKQAPDAGFEVVYETAAQYIPKQKLREYLVDLHRVVGRDLVIVLHTREHDPEPHAGQVNFLTNAAWRTLLTEAGFIEAGSVDDPPYWFTKAPIVATAQVANAELQVSLLALNESIPVVEDAFVKLRQHANEVDHAYAKQLETRLAKLTASLKQLKQLGRQLLHSEKLGPLVKSAANSADTEAKATAELASKIKTELDWLADIRSAVDLAAESINKLKSSI